MSRHTSFKAGGCADLLVCPKDADQLQKVLAVVADVPHMVLGNGSNVLVRDRGYRGVIVKIGEDFSYIRREGSKLICGAGALMSAVAKKAAAEGRLPSNVTIVRLYKTGRRGERLVNATQMKGVNVLRDGDTEKSETELRRQIEQVTAARVGLRADQRCESRGSTHGGEN